MTRRPSTCLISEPVSATLKRTATLGLALVTETYVRRYPDR